MSKSEISKYETREEWLVAAIHQFSPDFTAAGATLPKVRVACGWPSSRGTAAKSKALGECWDKSASTDKVAQVFISPFLSDPLDSTGSPRQGILPTLVHELVHAALGNDKGHGKEFKKVATALGLEGKMTRTTAGDALIARCADVAKLLGEYPHAQIIPGKGEPAGKKKQSTRMIKCECEVCGYTVRTTRKWLEVGAPLCPKHGAMMFDETAIEGDDDSNDGDTEI